MAIFTGTADDDSILGTDAGDDFHLEQGGADTASGGGGIDVFYFGASFGAGDQVTGGAGRDYLVLDGDYSAGVAVAFHQLRGISDINLTDGNSYALSGLDNVRGKLRIDGSDLSAGDSIHIDAGGKIGALRIDGGAGDDLVIGGASLNQIAGGDGADTLTGGDGGNTIDGGRGSDLLTGGTGSDSLAGDEGNDTLIGGMGADSLFDSAGDNSMDGGEGDDFIGAYGGDQTMIGGQGDDHFQILGALGPDGRIDGGDGANTLQVYGFTAAMTLDDAHVHEVQAISFANGNFVVTTTDDLIPAGGLLTVTALSASFIFDGTAETDGRFSLTGSGGNDVMRGGDGADTISSGGGGSDSLVGGGGDDILRSGNSGAFYTVLDGGAGGDILYASGKGNTGTTRLDYHQIGDSTPDSPDVVIGLSKFDQIYLTQMDADTTQDGDQDFTLVAAFDGHAGELTLSYDHLRKVTNLEGDVDGDGHADFLVVLEGKHADFDGFLL